MIKNQLYPYIEKYINEYLHGFSKEQLEVGVMNGTVLMEKVNLKVDKVNEKLDSQNMPFWIKAGFIKKIKLGCSLMNFIGEKPLEVEVDEIEVLLSPSCRWILANLNSFIEETEEYILENYDANDNNSYNIFEKKLSVFDWSIFKKKQQFYTFLKEKGKLADFIHKIFTNAFKFYNQSNFFLNTKINKIHIRYEDDIFNYFGGTIFGVRIDSTEISLSADGKLKKDFVKFTNFNIYTEEVKSLDNFFINSSQFLSLLNNKAIDDQYYKDMQQALKREVKSENCFNLIKDFNFQIRFGISSHDSGSNLFMSKKDKHMKFYVYFASGPLNLSISPTHLGKIISIQDFFKCYFLNEQIQQYKPMRKPYNMTNELVIKSTENANFQIKRKLVVRDWFYYFIMFYRFRKAMYNKPFKNELQEEFSKYFNIFFSENLFPDVNNNNEEEFKDEKSVANSRFTKMSTVRDLEARQKTKVEETPDTLCMSLSFDISIRCVNLDIFESNFSFSKNKEKIHFCIQDPEIKIHSNFKDKLQIDLKIPAINAFNFIGGKKILYTLPAAVEFVHDSKKLADIEEKSNPFLETFEKDTQSVTSKLTYKPSNKIKLFHEMINSKGTTQKSPLLGHFIEEVNELEEERKNNLTQKIKEHNKKFIKPKNKPEKDVTPTTSEENFCKVNIIQATFSKENYEDRVKDKALVFTDLIRFNFNQPELIQVTKILMSYAVYLKNELRLKKQESFNTPSLSREKLNFMNMVFKKLKAKMDKEITKDNPNYDFFNDYYEHLDKEIKHLSKLHSEDTDKHKIFKILSDKTFEIAFDINTIATMALNLDNNYFFKQVIGKFISSKNHLKVKNDNKGFIANYNDHKIELFNINNWSKVYSTIKEILAEKLSMLKAAVIEPFIDSYAERVDFSTKKIAMMEHEKEYNLMNNPLIN